MSEKEQTDLATITSAAGGRCPVCGAGDLGQQIENTEITGYRCGHCRFRTSPLIRPENPVHAPSTYAAASLIHDLGLVVTACRILALAAPNDGRAIPEITYIDTTRITERAAALPPFDVILAGQALDYAADVNRLMANLSHLLNPRGLIVADVEQTRRKGRFGGKSLQILLERHGFRLVGRPLKWRLTSFGPTRRILARKI